MATIRRFEDLEIWKEARELSKYVFLLSNKIGFKTDFKLKDQIRSAAGSAMDNIAEGFERDGNKEFVNFLTISKGSVGEVRSQAYRAFDYNYIDNEELEQLIVKTLALSEKIAKFISYLKNCEYKGNKFKTNEPETEYQISEE